MESRTDKVNLTAENRIDAAPAARCGSEAI
jgi:hypothetical protein